MSITGGNNLCRSLWKRKVLWLNINIFAFPTKPPCRHFSGPVCHGANSTKVSLHRQPKKAPMHSAALPRLHPKATDMSKHSIEMLEQTILEHAKANRIGQAYRLIDDLYQSGKTPSIKMYNSIIKAHAKNFGDIRRQRAVDKLLDEMVLHGVKPTSTTYMQLLMGQSLHDDGSSRAIRNMRSWFDGLMALEAKKQYRRTGHRLKKLFKMMASVGHRAIQPMILTAHNAGVSFDAETWNEALVGCVYGGRMDAAEQLFEYFRARHLQKDELTVEAYHTLIRGHLCQYRSTNARAAQINVDAAIRVFRLMLEDNVKADQKIYECFTKAYASDAVSLEDDNSIRFETLRQLWQAIIKTSRGKPFIDETAVASLLAYYLKHDALSDAEQIYWDLRNYGHRLDRPIIGEIHKTIIKFAKQHHLISAMTLFYDLLSHGCQPSTTVIFSIIRACSERGDLESAKQMLEVIKEVKTEDPSIRIRGAWYVLLLREYCRLGDVKNAENLYASLVEIGDASDVSMDYARDVLIKAYFKSDDVQKAENIWRSKAHFTTRALNIMVEGYSLLEMWDQLDSILAQPFAKPDAATHNIIVQAKLQCGDLEGAQAHLVDRIKVDKIESMVSSIQAVLQSCALEGDVEASERWFETLQGAESVTAKSYESLLVCYVKAKKINKVQAICKEMKTLGFDVEKGVSDDARELCT